MIAVAMDTWGRNKASEALDKLERGEHELGAAVWCRLGQPRDEARLGRVERNDAGGSMQTFEREGRSSTVTEQAFDARAVVALDSNRCIDAEPAGALPGQHSVRVGFVEQASAVEVAEHAPLNDVLEFVPVLGSESCGLMETDRPALAL